MSESPQPDGTQHPISAQPWSAPSGDPLSASPSYQPGEAPIPPPQQPPTSQFPPVNYAPPGYSPDYGAPQYGAPGYGPPQYGPPQYGPPQYGPPQYGPGYQTPPPRKSNAPLIAVVIAVALLLCGGVSTAGLLIVHNVQAKARAAVKPLTDPTLPGIPDGGFPTDLPTGAGKQIQVTYEVTGDGPAQIIYLPKLGASPTRADNVKLPWRFTATMETPTLLSVIAMRSGADDGSITCRALVDGKEVKKTSSGSNGFATAACTYFALD